MSLLVVPLPSGDAAADRQVREVVARVLGGVPRHDGTAERPREPVVVAALEREGWDDLGSVHGRVLLPDPPPRGEAASEAEAEARRVAVLRRALDVALEHRARLRLAPEAGQASSSIVWLVVGVVPRGPAQDARAIRGFAEVAGWVDAAAKEISAGRYALDPSSPLALTGCYYVPWAFLAEPPAGAAVPASLTLHPSALGAERRTIIYTGRAAGGHALRWRDHGVERLFADMLAIHALSASVDSLGVLFGLPGEDSEFYTLHSSTFEYPLTEGIRRERLRTLLSSGDGEAAWQSVLPDMRRIDEARERARPSVQTEAQQMVLRVREVVERDEIPHDHYDFGTYRHRPEPAFDRLQKPAADYWQDILDARWSVLDPPRQVDAIVADVEEAIRNCALDDSPRVIERAVREARASIDRLRHELQGTLTGSFPTLSPPPGLMMSQFAFAVGATLAKLEVLRAECARHERSPEPIPDPSEQLALQISNVRTRCIADEDELLRQGARIPSRGALYLEVGAAALVFPIGLVAAPLLWRKRTAEQKAYFDQWDDVSKRWREHANQALEPLVRSVNARSREVKKVAALELAGVIEGCVRRFRLEVRGFIDMVQGQNSDLQRRKASAPPAADAERVGRFVYAPDATATLTSEVRRRFEEQLARTLAPSLSLVGMPERVAVAAYDELLRTWLVTDEDEARVRELYRDAATEQFERAIGWGLETLAEVSDVGAFFPNSDWRKIVIVGSGVARRLRASWTQRSVFAHDVKVIGTEDDDEPRRAVVASFAPEIAVCIVARGHRASGGLHGR